MSECLIYQLKPGTTMVGSVDGGKAHIRLSGEHILEEHCIVTNTDGEVTLECKTDARTFVNGKRVTPNSPVKLSHGFRVILGDFHVFRFNDPAGVRAHRTRMSGMWGPNGIQPETPSRSDSPAPNAELMDWTAARREVADISALGNEDLDKLFDDIVRWWPQWVYLTSPRSKCERYADVLRAASTWPPRWNHASLRILSRASLMPWQTRGRARATTACSGPSTTQTRQAALPPRDLTLPRTTLGTAVV